MVDSSSNLDLASMLKIPTPDFDLGDLFKTGDGQLFQAMRTADPNVALNTSQTIQSAITDTMGRMTDAVSQHQAAAANATAAAAATQAVGGGVDANGRPIIGTMDVDQQRQLQVLGNSVANSYFTKDSILAANAKLDSMRPGLDAEQADIQRRMANGVLDDPLQWIYDQFALPSDKAAYNMHADMYNDLHTKLQSSIAEGSEAFDKIQHVQVTLSAEQADLQKQAILQKALAVGEAAKAAAAQSSIPNLVALQNSVGANFNETLQNYDANTRRMVAAVQVPLIQDQTKLADIQLHNHDVMVASLSHYNSVTGSNISEAQFNDMDLKQKQSIMAISAQAATGSAMSPSDTFEAWQTSNAPMPNPAMRAAYDQMRSQWAAITAQVTSAGNKAQFMTPEAQHLEIKRQFDAWASTLNKGTFRDTDPSYGMPTYQSLSTAIEKPPLKEDGTPVDTAALVALKSNPLYQAIIKPGAAGAATSQGTVSSGQIIQVATAQLQAGDITPQQFAAQVSQIFQGVKLFNNTFTNHAALGLPLQTETNVSTPERPGLWLSGNPVTKDFSNYNEALNFALLQKNSTLRSMLGYSRSTINYNNSKPNYSGVDE